MITVVNAGTVAIGSSVDVTDPCYKKGSSFSVWSLPVRPGKYVCTAEVDTWTDDMFGEMTRTNYIDIRHSDAPSDLKYTEARVVTVDSGMVGFFANKPDFDKDEWAEFCRGAHNVKGQFVTKPTFFFLKCKDGSYTVSTAEDNGEIVGVRIAI